MSTIEELEERLILLESIVDNIRVCIRKGPDGEFVSNALYPYHERYPIDITDAKKKKKRKE